MIIATISIGAQGRTGAPLSYVRHGTQFITYSEYIALYGPHRKGAPLRPYASLALGEAGEFWTSLATTLSGDVVDQVIRRRRNGQSRMAWPGRRGTRRRFCRPSCIQCRLSLGQGCLRSRDGSMPALDVARSGGADRDLITLRRREVRLRGGDASEVGVYGGYGTIGHRLASSVCCGQPLALPRDPRVGQCLQLLKRLLARVSDRSLGSIVDRLVGQFSLHRWRVRPVCQAKVNKGFPCPQRGLV